MGQWKVGLGICGYKVRGARHVAMCGWCTGVMVVACGGRCWQVVVIGVGMPIRLVIVTFRLVFSVTPIFPVVESRRLVVSVFGPLVLV